MRMSTQSRDAVPAVTQDALPDNAALLDVRENNEWAAGRAPHALHIPMDEVGIRQAEIPRDRQIVVVCRSGGRSSRVVEYLLSQGFDAVNLAGGMQAWHAAGRPMTHDGPGCPMVI